MILFSKFEKKPKYENNKIPKSLHGSLSCVEFLGTSQQCNQNMICNDDLCITFQIENLGCYIGRQPGSLESHLFMFSAFI